MKANLKKMLGLAALGVTLLATTTPTWAGSMSTPEVYIATRNGIPYASGSLVGARYSADSYQMIGCELLAGANERSPSLHVNCYAADNGDNGGNFASCESYDQKDIEAVQAMTDSSYIYFEELANGHCGNLTIYNSSAFLK